MHVYRHVPLLAVRSLKESRRFYCDVLHFQIVGIWGNEEGGAARCAVRRGGAELCLEEAPAQELPGAQGVILHFLCDSVEQVFHEAREWELETNRPALTLSGNRRVYLADPDGYQLCFEEAYPPDADRPGREKPSS